MKAKKGYEAIKDEKKGLTHYVPIEGRSHLLGVKCWCMPMYHKKQGTVHHYLSRRNNAECASRK